MPVGTLIQLRRGIAEGWTIENPTLAEGEVGLELDTGKFKWGDGETVWADLAYVGGSFPGWTADDSDPANVSANGGTLALGGGEDEIDDDLILLAQKDVPGNGDRVFLKGSTLDGGTSYALYYQRLFLRTVMALYENGDWYFDTGLDVPRVRLSLKGFDGQLDDVADFWTGGRQASFTTDAFGSGAIIEFIAASAGASAITIELVDPGMADQELSVGVVDGAVTVNLATDGGGAITSTAAEISDAVANDEGVSSSIIANTLNDGIVDALAETPLTGGLDSALAWGLLGNGGEYLFAIDEPSDDTVQTSQRVQWFEDTSGAPKLRIKEKDSDGTLVERISAVLTSDGTAFAGLVKPSVSVDDLASLRAALVTLGLITDDT